MAALKLKIVRPGSFDCFPSLPLDDGLTPRSSSSVNVPHGEHCGWAPPAWLKPIKEVGLVQLILVDNGNSRTGRPGNAQSYHLRGKPWITIGRSEQACVRLGHPTASRAHAALMHAEDGMVYLIDFGSAHGTSTGGSSAKPVPCHLPTVIASGTLLRFGDSGSPLFLVKYCTKQQLLGHKSLNRQTLHQQLQLPFTPTSPHPQPGNLPPSPLERQQHLFTHICQLEEHPSPQQDQKQPVTQLPEPSTETEDDSCDPLTPSTVINTQLNAVLPSFLDSRRHTHHTLNKRVLEHEDSLHSTTACGTSSSSSSSSSSSASPSFAAAKSVSTCASATPQPRCKRVCFNTVGQGGVVEPSMPSASGLECEHPESEVTSSR